MNKKNIIALIPARGGSKRLPRKNIIKFNGKPMIAHTIENAKKSKVFSDIYVSTEDEEIAKIAKKYGAKVAYRNHKLADDKSMLKEVCRDFILNYNTKKNDFKFLCILLATSPFRNFKDIKKVISLIEPNKCDFAMAVTTYDLPIYQALEKKNNGYVKAKWPRLINLNEKKVSKYVVDNGSTYVFNTKKFLKIKSFYGPNLKVYEMPKSRSVDLNTLDDLKLLNFLLKKI